MTRWGNLKHKQSLLVLTIALSLIGVSIWMMHTADGRLRDLSDSLHNLTRKVEQMPGVQSAATRTTTVETCPAIGGASVQVTTNRLEGETATEHSERHVVEHNAQVEACKLP